MSLEHISTAISNVELKLNTYWSQIDSCGAVQATNMQPAVQTV